MDIFSKDKQAQIAQAVADAEANTSGEIRVCVEHHCPGDTLNRARECFNDLGMHKTKLRNGVMIYMAIDDHKFAVIGDKGINEQVEEGFWDDTKEKMLVHFKAEHITDGLIAGIVCIGEKLKKLFPSHAESTNELSNDMVFIDKHQKKT